MSMQKKTIIIAVIIAAVAIAMAAIYFFTRPKTTQGEKTFTVEVVHSDGRNVVLNITADTEYLGDALQIIGLIEGETGEFGLYMTTVDGEEAIYEENGAYWALYEGENYARQGIDQTPIVDGAAYSLVYTVG